MIKDIFDIVNQYLMISEINVRLHYFYVMCDLLLETSKFDYEICTCPKGICLNCIEDDFISDDLNNNTKSFF